MSSKKGAFIYQQIELTTAEWAADTTIYPASVWLFERLETGKFNMKLADGVHAFTDLPAVMQDIKAVVKTNDETTYILTITTADGTFDTPNLKGAKGDPFKFVDFTEQQLNALKVKGDKGDPFLYEDFTPEQLDGLKLKYSALTDEDKAELKGAKGDPFKFADFTEDQLEGLKGQDGQSAYLDAKDKGYTGTKDEFDTLLAGIGKGLSANDFTNDYKQRLDEAIVPTDVFTATSLSQLSPTKYSQKFTYTTTTAQPINFASAPAEGFECILDIKNGTSSQIIQAIPNAAAWQCDETSLVIPAGKIGCISIRYVHGKYCVRVGL